MNFFLIFIIFIGFFLNLEAKIRLLTFHYNRPDFIELQKKGLDKFLKERDDYELIVFNDAPSFEMEKAIQDECDKWGVQCVRFQQEWHHHSDLIDAIEEWAKIPNLTGLAELSLLKGRHPSIRHCHVIQYALDNYGYCHDDIVGIMDGDLFLIRPFSVRNYLKNYQIIGSRKTDQTGSVDFFWVVLCLFNMKELPNKESLRFNITCIENHMTDSGGHSHHYLKNNPLVSNKKYQPISLDELRSLPSSKLRKQGYDLNEITFIKKSPHNSEFHMDGHFLHYLRSSFTKELNEYASETKNYHDLKTEVFSSFIKNKLK